MRRRDFLQTLAVAAAAGAATFSARAAESVYDFPPFGGVRILHTADLHAQARPTYYREPSANLGLGTARGKPPHVVGEHALAEYGIRPNSALAHAVAHVGFDELARVYGKTGGLSRLASLAEKLRGEFGREKTLHLDSGDLLQGSAVALRNNGRDMIDAANKLGIDALTGHWEFTYPEPELRKTLSAFSGAFVAQNIFASEDALFDGAEVYDEDTGRVFPPYVVREVGGRAVAIIGQAFPFTPISNPRRFIPDWTFGIRAGELQSLVDDIREKEKPDLVVLLSHNGADLDMKVASEVSGMDFVFAGHSHDAIPRAIPVRNRNGRTWILAAGCCGKFVGCLDVEFGANNRRRFRHRLLPVFSDHLPESPGMAALLKKYRAPHAAELDEALCVAGETLHRRGNFNGGMDQMILDSLREHYGAQVSLSPGFRWGATALAGDDILMDDLMNATATTYPETYAREMTGGELRAILEDVADNLFHPDPYYRQGGDMVRVGGMDYELTPSANRGTRVGEMRLDNGSRVDDDAKYKVAGWSTTSSVSPGPPVWEIAANYLRSRKTYRPAKLNLPTLRGAKTNPGLSDYPPELLI